MWCLLSCVTRFEQVTPLLLPKIGQGMGLGLFIGVTTQTLGAPGNWVILNHPSVPYAYEDTWHSGIPSYCVLSAAVPSDLVKGNGSHSGVSMVTCVMSAQTAFIHCPLQLDPCLHLSLEILIPSGKVTQTRSPVYSPGCFLGPQEPQTTMLCWRLWGTVQ